MKTTIGKKKKSRKAKCSCGSTSFGNGMGTGRVYCMLCDKEWDGKSGTYPDGATVYYPEKYNNWTMEEK